MFNKANSHLNWVDNSQSVAFKDRIAPKIAAHIEKPIAISIAGEDSDLNSWLAKNLSTISSLQIRKVTQQRSKKSSKTGLGGLRE
ncbi:hypothetical protein [Rickettsiella massiliensis]|uniref:hypothetical protein n=1 Tax=Rickettsiella massiliensis TaxID=676517 RepID=UPI00029B3D28|nr:hypothetical protein [Rickettsiella massiliensis]